MPNPPWKIGRLPGNLDLVAGRRDGFTLLELMVSLGLLATVMVPVGYVILSSSRAFSSLAKQSHLVARATVVADRLVDELNNGRLLNPPNPVQSTWIRFDKIVDVVGGAPVYGDPIQIDLVPMEASNTDNLDNDGDGIVDEGGVRIWTDVAPLGNSPGPEDEQAIISASIAKSGLLFTRQGAMVLLDLTFASVNEPGGAPTDFYLGSGALMN